MPTSHGLRHKSRKILRKKRNEGFMRRLLENLNLGKKDKVAIRIDPAFHQGAPHRRFHGKIGVIVGRRGRAFEVKTNKGEKEVILIVRPEHLVRLK